MFTSCTWCFYNENEDGYESFAVVSEYFGQSVFNKLTVVTKLPGTSHLTPASANALQAAEQSAVNELRLQSDQREKGSRMQFTEQQQNNSNLETKVTKFEPQVHTKKSSFISSGVNKMSTIVNNYSTNPFDETYDESKNPFAHETKSDPTNPFSDDDDDYDETLNPFHE